MLNIWTKPSGYTWTTNQFGFDGGTTFFDQKTTVFDPGAIVERVNLTLPLPIILPAPTNLISFSIISGALPPGVAINGTNIVGIPYGVVRDTTYTFCIRASNSNDIADRTFSITVATAGPPEFITSAGFLPVGANNKQYILNNNFLNYTLSAKDPDGQGLTYFISSGNGQLPPGVTLSSDGVLSGYVNPVLSIQAPEGASGQYDEDLYDSTFYDFGSRPSNGFDSYLFDAQTFDFNTPTLPPKTINQRYEFIVTVASAAGKTTQRKFSILVVSPDLLTADDAVIKDDTTLLTADATPLEQPIFVTNSNLGTYRANNYILIEIDTFSNLTTTIDPIFTITSGILPPGLAFSPVGSKVYLAGNVPFQAAISKTYSFTITATRTYHDIQSAVSSTTFSVTMLGEVNNNITWNTDSNLGFLAANYICNLGVSATADDPNAVLLYELNLQPKETGLPPGLTLDISGEITGKVNQYGVPNIARTTSFENGAWYLDRHYTTIDGSHQYDILGARGLILFDAATTATTFDHGTTNFDRTYQFTVKATDQYGYAVNSKKFTLTISTPNQILYSNIRTQPFLKLSQRDSFSNFINDPTIFTINSVYRPADPNFGIKNDLSMLVYAGIESKTAAQFVGAIGLNHKRKRFQFGSISKGVAIENGKTIYEVVYISMIDPLEQNGKVLPNVIRGANPDTLRVTVDTSDAIWKGSDSIESFLERPLEDITVDSGAFSVSDINPIKYYPSSISNWQHNIETVGQAQRNYLPIWMRSIQPGANQELGFKLAVPLCYCKPGTADKIMLNIKHSGFDFKTLDYTVDRYIIDSVEGYSSDKYLVFRNDRITV
jgi:hypothetical protein